MPRIPLIVGLDIGSSSIKSLVATPRADGEELEVLSSISLSCLGVRRGVVVDVDKVAQGIAQVLKQAEEECGERIEEVFVNLGGSHLFSLLSRGTVAVSRADGKISEEDIERVNQAAQTFSLPPNREILEIFPREYVVDGEGDIRQAVGMEGVRLESEILVLGYFSPYMKNLTKAVLNAGFGVAGIIATPLASAKTVLTPQEKELGVLLIDIGAGTTSFCVYKEGVLVGAGVVPIGSFHLTKDIATGLETDIETAEKIKIQYAACNLKGAKKIKVKELVSGEEISFSRAVLGRIVDARITEIFEQIKKELKKTGETTLAGGAVLSGGGANLPKLKDFTKKSLKMTCRFGQPQGFFPAQREMSHVCVCGLTAYGKEIEDLGSSNLNGFFRKIKKMLKTLVP